MEKFIFRLKNAFLDGKMHSWMEKFIFRRKNLV